MAGGNGRAGRDHVRLTLERLRLGDISAADARKLLRGHEMPNRPAELLKKGVWASGGDYIGGENGARAAAEDALKGAGWDA